MTAMLVLVLLTQDGSRAIEGLVRDLGDDLIEIREKAHARLQALGVPCIPSLRKALESSDAEVRLRASLLLEIVERIDRERTHDAAQKEVLLRSSRTPSAIEAERRPGSGTSEGARFDVEVTPFDAGWVVTTRTTDYLARQASEGIGKGRLHFDIGEISGADGRPLTVERCGRCSPAKVFVRGTGGPLTVRIQGRQTWFSPYLLEFKDPCPGQKKRVGDYTIGILGRGVMVTSEKDWPVEWCWSMNPYFDYELKPHVKIGGRSRTFS